jgi:hypothetical protein
MAPIFKWQRVDLGHRRARQGFSAKAGLPARHRRECRDANGEFTRHSRESGNLEPSGPSIALDPRFRGATKSNTSSRAFRVFASPKAFAEAGVTHNDVDDLMIYDALCSLPGAGFAHLPIYGLEDLGFAPKGETGPFSARTESDIGCLDGNACNECIVGMSLR